MPSPKQQKNGHEKQKNQIEHLRIWYITQT